MTTRTTKRRTVELYECPAQSNMSAARDGSPVIENVKICGYESANKRRYTPEAFDGAIPMYENCAVFLNHPQRPTDSRDVRDRFGKLEGVYRDAGGLWAKKLVYNPMHTMAETIRWWADSMPEAIGFSHNAVGSGRDEGGVFIVEKLLSVRSCDIVSDAATTKGLRESIDGITPNKKRFGANQKQALKNGFRAACVAVLDDQEMDAAAKIAKLKKLLSTHEKLADDGKPSDLDQATESRVHATIRRLRREVRAQERGQQLLHTHNGFKRALFDGLASVVPPLISGGVAAHRLTGKPIPGTPSRIDSTLEALFGPAEAKRRIAARRKK